jgi:putative hydrolase of the HAD superfamily
VVTSNGHIRWVFFDFAGTLAFNDPPRVWHYLRACARRGVFLERREVREALNKAWAAVDSEAGIAHPEASADQAAYEAFRIGLEAQILDMLGVTRQQEEIIHEFLTIQDSPQAYTLYPEADTTLARLRAAGYELGIVSNFTWALPDLVRELGLGAHIATVLTSARIGYRKPHPRIFQAAVTATGAIPAESLFVGDSYKADVEGAASYGFQSLLVDRRRTGRHPCPSIAFLSELETILPFPREE